MSARLLLIVAMLHAASAWTVPGMVQFRFDCTRPAKGLIGDPKNTRKSLDLTDDGVADAAAAFQRLFGIDGEDG